MNKNKVFLLIVFTLSVSLSGPAGALGLSDAVKAVVQSMLSKAGKPKLCRKADLFSGVVSLRSFSGLACSQKTLAAFAIKHCSGFEDFDQSSCASLALKALGRDAENVDKALGDDLTKLSSDKKKESKDELKAICDNIDADDMTPKQAKACGKTAPADKKPKSDDAEPEEE